jgi:hypothetical protein
MYVNNGLVLDKDLEERNVARHERDRRQKVHIYVYNYMHVDIYIYLCVFMYI